MSDLKNKIEQILEGQGLKEADISNILGEISSIDMGELDPTISPHKNINEIENDLKTKMDDEKDWRKKAKLAARIISLNLE